MNVLNVDNKLVNLHHWYVGGRTNMRSLWKHYYNDIDCLVFIVDSSDRDRNAKPPTEHGSSAHELRRLLQDEKLLAGVPLLIFANKQDLSGAMSPKEVGEHLQLGNLCAEDPRPIGVYGSVALTGQGFQDAYTWLGSVIDARRKGTPAPRFNDTKDSIHFSPSDFTKTAPSDTGKDSDSEVGQAADPLSSCDKAPKEMAKGRSSIPSLFWRHLKSVF